MRITLTQLPNQIGEIHFYLNGLENIGHFDVIKRVLVRDFRSIITREYDGIWFKRADLKRDNDEFILYWHEDVGNFLVSFDQSEDKNEKLENLIKEVIPLIEFYFNQG